MGKRAGHGAPPPRLSARSDPPSTRRRARAKTARAARPDGRRGRRQLVGVLRDEAGVDLAALEAGQVQDHGVVDRRRGDAEDDQLRAAARASAPGAPAPRAVLAHSAVRLAGWHLCNLDGGRPLATYIAYYTCMLLSSQQGHGSHARPAEPGHLRGVRLASQRFCHRWHTHSRMTLAHGRHPTD